MKDVFDASFKTYGKILDVDVSEFLTVIDKNSPTMPNTVLYEASVDEFEKLNVYNTFKNIVYGGMPIEFGHCSGFNSLLNGLEYHRDSEVDVAATDLMLILGHQWDIDYETNTYNTDKAEVFFVPRGTAVELYATTLHYAPCGINGKEFRCGVVLPRGTNSDLKQIPVGNKETEMLFAVNKWLLAHAESGIVGNTGTLIGKNKSVDDF